MTRLMGAKYRTRVYLKGGQVIVLDHDGPAMTTRSTTSGDITAFSVDGLTRRVELATIAVSEVAAVVTVKR